MKNKTNVSVKDIRGVRITPYMELGENHGHVSGDLLDANATTALVEKKISEVVGGASSAFDTLKEIETIINSKQDSIVDLQTIREGAAAGATAYQKPVSGIPESDMSEGVQAVLAKANSAVQTETDPVFSGSPAAEITQADINNWNAKQSAIGDLEDIRQGAAAGATAIQEHQDISGKANIADLAAVATSGSYLDLSNIPVAQMYYTFISYNPQDETEEWGRGIVKTTGGEVGGNIEVEVLSNTEEEFVGKKFYITSDAEPGDDTLYPLYTVDGTAVGISVKIIEQMQ